MSSLPISLFFTADCQILGDRDGVHLVKTAEGRATGECFVEMLTLRDVDEALRKDHQHMGHRYVEVSPLHISRYMFYFSSSFSILMF